MKTDLSFTTLSAVLLAITLMLVLAPSIEAQNRTDNVKFSESISYGQPILLKRFNTDSVAFAQEDKLSDALKNQQKKMAVREISLNIYNRMTKRGFSVHSFENTPARARENMRDAIVVEGRIDQIEGKEKSQNVTVTIKIYPADDPDTLYAEFSTSGKLRIISAQVTQRFTLSVKGK